jgi:hypothetical protein
VSGADENKRSSQWFQTPGYHGILGGRGYAVDYPADVFDGKPIIGICNSWSELNTATPTRARWRRR